MKDIHKDTSAKARQKGGWIALAVCGVLLVLGVGVGVGIYMSRDDGKDNPSPPSTYFDGNKTAQGTIIDGAYGNENQEETETVGEGYFEMKMSNTAWDCDSETMAAEGAWVANVDSNVYDMYFVLKDSKEQSTVYYTSPVIKIGQTLTDIALDTVLEPGRYECIMEHHLLDPETNQELDGLDVYFTINIKDVEAN